MRYLVTDLDGGLHYVESIALFEFLRSHAITSITGDWHPLEAPNKEEPTR